MFPTFEPHIGFLVSVRSLALHMDREKDRHFSPWEDHNALSSDKFAESLFEYARSPTVSNICTINICNNLCFDESVHFWIFHDFSVTSRPRFRILLIHSAFSHDIDPLSKGEVGFHAGHSAAIMLNANAKARVFVLRAHDDRLRVSIVQPWMVWNDSQDFNLFLDFLIFSFQHA